MSGNPIHHAEILVLLLLVFIAGFGIVAQRLKVAYPIVLVLGGLLVSIIPGLPRISLDPDFIFVAVLPPLLFATAIETSWAEFRYNLVSITSLAFGLVSFTVLGVSLAAHWLIPDFDWRVGLVLGAAVAPTDAIAATAIAQRLGLPKHIVDLLEGESLLNDATGLLALQFSTALVVSGTVPSLLGGVSRFAYLTAAGILIGLAVAAGLRWIQSKIDNTPVEIALSLVTPYLTYSLAEAAAASGVLAVVACGLYLGRQRSVLFSPRLRVEGHYFWNTFAFLLNGAVFLLIGLQLPLVLNGIRNISPLQLAISAAQLAASVILLRLLWVVPATYVGYFVRRKVLHQAEDPPSLREEFILGWTGMRGVVSLAAALSLPVALSNGAPFSQRNPLIFLTFTTILVTLVLQGLTLPALIRSLNLPRSNENQTEEQRARRQMVSAALQRIEELRENDSPEFKSMYDAFARFYQQRLQMLSANTEELEAHEVPTDEVRERYEFVGKQVRQAERSALISLEQHNRITAEVVRHLEHGLDLLDLRAPDR